MAKVEDNINEWQMNCVDLKQRGNYLLHSGLWSDCAFRVGDEVIKAHKLMLAMASSVFGAMFYGGLHESSTAPILIEDIEPEVFSALLEFVYTDGLGEISCDIACGLYLAADRYMLPHLVKQCSTYIATNISAENVCQAYELATLFDNTFLMDKCLQFISFNTKQVLEDSSLMEVQLNTLLKVFTLENLAIDSELELVNTAERYKQNNQVTTNASTSDDKVLQVSVPDSTSSDTTRATLDSTDKLTIRHVTAQIRFLTLAPQQFRECLSDSPLLTDLERYAVLANIHSTSSNIPMPNGFSISRESRNATKRINESLAASNTGVVYCTREYTPRLGTNHSGKTYCNFYFSVDRHVSLLGLQVPSQVDMSGGSATYQECIRVVLYESQTRYIKIAEVNFRHPVKYDDLMDIKFQTSVALRKGQIYYIQIDFKSVGPYPRGECSVKASGRVADAAVATFRITRAYCNNDLLRSLIIEKRNNGT